MYYVTATQLSERWNVTPRYIQDLCRNGRLPGCMRMGKVWMLPDDVEKPADRRRKGVTDEIKKQVNEEICWSVIGAAYRVPGTESELIKSLSDKPCAAALVKAQFEYLHGNIEGSEKISKDLFNASDDFEIRIGAAFLMGTCAMYKGDVLGWQNARSQIEKIPCCDDDYASRKALWLAIYGASIYDVSDYPEWFRRGCFDSLPRNYRPAAMVHYAKYIYISGDAMLKNKPVEEQALKSQFFLLTAICEPLISQTVLDKALISEIYLRLICASSYHHAGNDILAAEHIDRALTIALPDRILAPFAEQRFNLDSLIDERMKSKSVHAYNEMKALHNRLINGWSVIHNTLLNRSLTTGLTAKELEAARLAVFGLTNNEIANRMGISINSVKGYLQSAMEKTSVSKRTELAPFV